MSIRIHTRDNKLLMRCTAGEYGDVISLLEGANIPYSISSNIFTIKEKYVFQVSKVLAPLKQLVELTPEFREWIQLKRKEERSRNLPLKIYVGVVNSRIDGDPSLIPVKEIESETRYFVKAALNMQSYKDGKWDGYINLFDKRYKKFPTGLLGLVETALQKKNVPYSVEYTYDQFPERELDIVINDGMTPDDDQLIAINCGVECGRGIIKAPTAFGKTAILAKRIIQRMGVPTLFIANKTILIDDAYKEFSDSMTLASGEPLICSTVQGKNFAGINLSKSEPKPIKSHIIVATIQSLTARLQDPLTAPYLKHWLKNVCKLVMIDECQALGTKTWDMVLSQCMAPYRIGLSATPRRTDGADIKLRACTGPNIFTTTAEKQIERGRLCDIDIEYKVYDHKIYNEKDTGLIYNECYMTFIANNYERNTRYIVEPAIDMIKEERPVLILVSSIDHGKEIARLLAEEHDINVPFLWGDTSKKKRDEAIRAFKNREIPIIIGSTIFDAGVNIPVIGGVVIGGAGNSDITLIQRIGRGARICDYDKVWGYVPKFVRDNNGVKKTRIVDIIDKNVKFFFSQSKNRYYNAKSEFGGDVVRIDGGEGVLRGGPRRHKANKEFMDDMSSKIDAAASRLDMLKEFAE